VHLAGFLKNPIAGYARSRSSITAVYIRAAWKQPAFRKFVFDRLARALGRHGSLEPCAEELALLGEALTPKWLVALYEHLRDHSMCMEVEWRAEFEEAFPHLVDDLPPMEDP
jgi:hypothetical protein